MSHHGARSCLLALALVTCCRAGLAAQDSLALPALLGKEVRAVAPRVAQREVFGHVIASDAGRLLVVTGDAHDTLALPVESIERLRVRAGGSGAGTGGLVGALVGGLVGAGLYRLWVYESYSNQEYAGLGALVVGAPVGALVGGVTGALLGAHGWRDVRLRR